MTRKKVKLAFIANDSARKATYKKRKKGLMKKVDELTTLCGIDACAIIYSPYESQPEVWPNPLGVQRVLAQFKRMPEMEQGKKMVNQESFIRQRIVKASDQLKKQHKDNREKEITEVMYRCLSGMMGLQNLALPDLKDLGWVIDQKLNEVYKRMEILKKNGHGGHGGSSSSQVNAVPATSAVNVVRHEPAVVEEAAGMENVQRPQWLTDWMNNLNDQQVPFGANDQVIMPFGDQNPNGTLPAGFFP